LSRIRHDLRTPINHILGYCEMLQEDEHTPAEFQADLRRIHAGGRQLLALMTEYFDEEIFATRRHDRFQLCHELRTPVNHIIGYGEMLEEQARAPGHERLLSDLRKITSAARRWLERMEAYLLAPSPAPQPAVPSPAPAAAPAPAALPAPAVTADLPLSPPQLLVVDDDEANRDMLARRLRRQGFAVAVASGGIEALQALRAQRFDLVLLDLVMPGLDGYEVLVRLKADPELAAVPVLMISAFDRVEGMARCIQAGAEDFLPKPFDPVLLRARVSAALEKKRLREQETRFLHRIQEEKHRVDELLHIILPRDVAAELKATGQVKPRRLDQVGVLFCDIVDFATYSDRRPPERIVPYLQTLVEAFEETAARHGLEKIKTIGDSFMAVAGLLAAVPNPGLDCVRCGLDLIADARNHPAGWTVRVGVHAGPVIAGIVGRKKYQYDVWGDTVNTAARLEQAGDPGVVCVAADLWPALASHVNGHTKGRVAIKGKGEMELHCVTGLASAAGDAVQR
jgi:class 3 adenylate cyclase/CheY-like chemotaxis protein